MNDLITVFERLGTTGPAETAERLPGTACVLGGGVAGLLAARVLSDYWSQVVLIERDFAVGPRPRPGVPQGRHVHTLLPGGLRWIENWLPGLTQEVQDGGGVLADPATVISYHDGQKMIRPAYPLLMASRPFIEAVIRRRVLGLANVSTVRARVTGLEYRDDGVAGVRVSFDAGEVVLPAQMVIDAMGRASKLSDWLSADGFERPKLERLHAPANYVTAMFQRDRRPEELDLTGSVARFGPPYPVDGLALATVSAIEGNRWNMMLADYDDVRPGSTVEEVRAACAKLPPPFGEAAGNPPIGEIATYHQADSRRRHFAATRYLPARLLSVGDAVASFNPTYGQGMSSAALHAACLAEFFSSGPDLGRPARGFFELQDIVVDAAWAVSAGGDAARLDAMNSAEVPKEIRQQRLAMDQIVRAAQVDEKVAQAFREVTYMISHPATLADPALVERAIQVNAAAVE